MNKPIFIHTPKAPEAIGPYSQAVKAGGFLYCSGQIPLDPTNLQVVAGGVIEQTEQVLKNLEAVLAEAGVTKNMVVKATVFLKNMEDFAAFNGLYEAFFEGHKPARSTVEVSALPKNVLIEIEAIALLPEV